VLPVVGEMETDVADAGLELKTACAEKVFAPENV
jgi:hypothetical protein